MKLRSTLALALVGALSLSAVAQKTTKSKATKAAKTAAKAAAKLTGIDGKTFSYAAGISQAESLKEYATARLGIDSTHFKDFVLGMQGNIPAAEAARLRALVAGLDIAAQNDQIVKQYNKVTVGKEDSSYVDKATFTRGLVDGIMGKAPYSADSAQTIAQRQLDYYLQTLKTSNAAYLTQYKKQKGVKQTTSGLLYRVVEQGKGALPVDTSQVEVHYEGRLIDGTVFDSSYKRGQTTTFGVSQVIKGWTEALKLMPVGSTYELCIPQELAYGERGNQAIPPFSTLLFKIELKAIK